ncbi:methionyl-tRNA formyltransferase Fmt [Gracilibacillus halophilus YIM-C55.5]|uniref:Methionyl-tRNA formyltransferase n=1 Tax=Gracilibacillus halophilus YIM-C55.5 TaxID=1308866 RepID=N4WQ69_9BACI|nr:methionyl-tRNA formyltransferase [Gracilibacillus halophilus]ENH98287.1 methionyl-tRNA formyltransferase Fmt [Gracilibacillus halophilus YIM-C55.5]
MKHIIFMGTPDFAVPVLEKMIDHGYQIDLVVTQPDRKKGRKKILTPPPVKEAAVNKQIPVFQPERIKDDFSEIEKLNPDLIVTAAFGQLLPKALLDIPRFGCINVHASLLPELRGGAPIHHAILQGKEKTGITLMYMAEKLDAGDIIAQREVDISEDDHVGHLHDKLSTIGAQLLVDTLPDIFAGTNQRVKQDDQKATYAPNITRDEEQIDWSQPMQTVYNQIRGLHPWPVAYTKWRGDTMKVWEAQKYSETFDFQPGEIVKIDSDGFVVTTGDQQGVKIVTLQPAGKKKMAATDFLRGVGHTLETHERLGE